MKITITIKPIFNDYCDKIVDLSLSIEQREFGLPITINQQTDLLDVETNYHQGGGNFWGALMDEELAETIAMINCGHNSACIRKMFVKSEYRGKELGTAQQLLNVLLQCCSGKEITAIYLGTVQELKAAHRFYERNGFTPIAAADLPSYFPRMPTDTLFYQLHLDKSTLL